MCGTCGRASAAPYQSNRSQITSRSSTPTNCDYTMEMMLNFEQKLTCAINKSLHSEISSSIGELNSFLGVVKSAISTNNVCYFASHLNNIQGTIIKILNTGKC